MVFYGAADCNADYECDSDVCTNNVCAAPPPGKLPVGAACGSSDDCVAIADCVEGSCVDAVGKDCGMDGDRCEGMNDCCGGGTCTAGFCSDDSGSGGAGGASGGDGTGGKG
jgi:hypothetical protein